MIVSKEKYSNDAFILSKADVQRVADVLSRFIGRPTLEIECRDGTRRRFDDIGGLWSFDNGWSNRIRSLWIRSADDEKMRRARLRFSAQHVPVYLEMAAEAEVTHALDGAIAGVLKDMQPGYLARGYCDLALALLAGCASAVAAFFATVALRSFWRAPANADLGAIGVLLAAELGGLTLAIAAGCLAGRPPGPLFPQAAFAVGRGLFRSRLLRILRGCLFLSTAGCLLGVIILNIGS